MLQQQQQNLPAAFIRQRSVSSPLITSNSTYFSLCLAPHHHFNSHRLRNHPHPQPFTEFILERAFAANIKRHSYLFGCVPLPCHLLKLDVLFTVPCSASSLQLSSPKKSSPSAAFHRVHSGESICGEYQEALLSIWVRSPPLPRNSDALQLNTLGSTLTCSKS